MAGGGQEDVSLAMVMNSGGLGRVNDDFGSKSKSSRFALRLTGGTGTARRCAARENSRIVVMCSSVSSRRVSVVELESAGDAVAGRGSAVVRRDEIAQEAAAKSSGRLEGGEKAAMASRIAEQEEEAAERDVRGDGGGGGEFGPGDENGDDVAGMGGHNSCPNDEEMTTTTKEPGMNGMRWSMLLSTTALEDAHLSRASSVTDAHVLRRKGRLKEQDGLIEFIISMHTTHSPFQVGGHSSASHSFPFAKPSLNPSILPGDVRPVHLKPDAFLGVHPNSLVFSTTSPQTIIGFFNTST